MIALFRTCIAGVSAEKTVTVSGSEYYDQSAAPVGQAAAAAADTKAGTTSPECNDQPSDDGVGPSTPDVLPQDPAPSPEPGNAQ